MLTGRFTWTKSVFGYSQTHGEELAVPELPEFNLTLAANALGLSKIPFSEISGNAQGYSVGTSFAISPLAPFPVKTTLHEMAHIVLGHTDADGGQHVGHGRSVKEFQAETVAYIVCHELSATHDAANLFDAATSRAYVQSWLADTQLTQTDVLPVFGAANKIRRPTKSDLYGCQRFVVRLAARSVP